MRTGFYKNTPDTGRKEKIMSGDGWLVHRFFAEYPRYCHESC